MSKANKLLEDRIKKLEDPFIGEFLYTREQDDKDAPDDSDEVWVKFRKTDIFRGPGYDTNSKYRMMDLNHVYYSRCGWIAKDRFIWYDDLYKPMKTKIEKQVKSKKKLSKAK